MILRCLFYFKDSRIINAISQLSSTNFSKNFSDCKPEISHLNSWSKVGRLLALFFSFLFTARFSFRICCTSITVCISTTPTNTMVLEVITLVYRIQCMYQVYNISLIFYISLILYPKMFNFGNFYPLL